MQSQAPSPCAGPGAPTRPQRRLLRQGVGGGGSEQLGAVRACRGMEWAQHTVLGNGRGSEQLGLAVARSRHGAPRYGAVVACWSTEWSGLAGAQSGQGSLQHGAAVAQSSSEQQWLGVGAALNERGSWLLWQPTPCLPPCAALAVPCSSGSPANPQAFPPRQCSPNATARLALLGWGLLWACTSGFANFQTLSIR